VQVDEARNIAMPTHCDYGSLVTIDLMLSDTSEFDGGMFETLEPDGTLLAHPFERGDALVLLSHKWHSVTPLRRGRRNILVSEIWEGLPRRCAQRCDQPWMPCLCGFEKLYAADSMERGMCWRGGLTDAERLLVNGRAFWEAEATKGGQSQPEKPVEEESESLLEWAKRVKEAKSAAEPTRPGE
jgi:hypothetical protein